jgi:hypothetical protein
LAHATPGLFLVALAALTAGCASGPGFQVVSTRPGSGPITAAELYPCVAGEWTFLVTQGDDAGVILARQRDTTTEHDAAWLDREADHRSEYWRFDNAGNLVMPVVIAHSDRAITFFDPPLIIAYQTLPPNRVLEQTVNMRVMDARKPTRLRDIGTARRTIEYVDDELVRTPLGLHWAKRVQITFEAKLRLARATNTSTMWVIPGVGPSVERRKEVITVLKVPVRRGNQTLVLMESPVELGGE